MRYLWQGVLVPFVLLLALLVSVPLASAQDTAAAPGAAADRTPPTGPAVESFLSAFLVSQLTPERQPAGSNDWSCAPTAQHPRPVVLIHGTFENRFDDFASMAPRLKAMGFCVYALNYGDDLRSVAGLPPALKATRDIRLSAQELRDFVDRVRASTGAAQVDLVGHSQGGVVARQYMRFEGGTNRDDPSRNVVAHLVTLGATNHGTTLSGLAALTNLLGITQPARLLASTAAVQQARRSDFIAQLNAAGDTDPGVDYTIIATQYDEVTTPYESTFLTAGPGATVRNVLIQDGCPVDRTDHLFMTYGARSAALVANGLEPTQPQPVPCLRKPFLR